MMTRLFLAAAIAAGLAVAPAAFAEDNMSKTGMSKDKMTKPDKMENKAGMAKPSDPMKQTGSTMDKKDGMSKDDMKK